MSQSRVGVATSRYGPTSASISAQMSDQGPPSHSQQRTPRFCWSPSLDPIFEVLLAARRPSEPKNALRVRVTLDLIEYVYAGGSVLEVPHGHSRYSSPTEALCRPAPILAPVLRPLLFDLRCSSICAYPGVTPSLRNRLLRLPASKSMDDLRSFVFDATPDLQLSAAIKTKRHLRLTTEAYVAFADAITASSHSFRLQTPDVPWIVPNQHFQAVREGHLDDLPSQLHAAIERNIVPAEYPSWPNWLPWMSLGAVGLLRTIAPKPLTALTQALAAFLNFMDNTEGIDGLWDDTSFPNTLLHVPVYALYPFRQGTLLLKVLHDLTSREIRTIRDLRCLHPDAVRLAKDATQPLLKLYNAFDDASPPDSSDHYLF